MMDNVKRCVSPQSTQRAFRIERVTSNKDKKKRVDERKLKPLACMSLAKHEKMFTEGTCQMALGMEGGCTPAELAISG